MVLIFRYFVEYMAMGVEGVTYSRLSRFAQGDEQWFEAILD